ncbi:M20/M25/M40 family metallo-hydrolase [Mucilaginibacter corticis]|uniref:M20/M25/M40 family metallo-hydrolase n=1 Tax=Mucilaginibacter corticis TaxID=2597670 RepID=A0A556MTS2_9SPHI|nr:M20/M25/M40 family metallo-hydrolase [Mucilaginibacter corticis]TSJ43346.1 M20/M25/M40 family metallo-hydrolase [Mucilaginibacter corticis]
MKRFVTILAFLGAVNTGFAQDVDKLIGQDDVTRIIKTLSADDMQGRATFTPGIEKAAKFIENEYKTIGLQPMAGNSGFRQNFSMIRSSAVKTSVSINGADVPTDNYIMASNTSFSWTKAEDATVAVITADMDFRKEYRKYLSAGKSTLVIVDPKNEVFFKRLQNYLKSNTSFKDEPTAPPLVFILGKYDEVKSFNVSDEVKREELPLFNIAGIIPGKTKPDEFVVFSGHYDHLGILTGANVMQGDSIANGADDDASGTTAVITLARYFKKLNNNARTLVFVAFTAEEIGEYGSAYFAKTVNPDKVMAMFNIEMIGKASKWGINSAFITGIERSDFGPILQKNLEGTAFKFYADPYPEQNLFYRSDNASLARVGVPAHTISTDQIDSDKLYHTVKDEFSSLDVANITATIKAIALSSKTIVSGQDTPTRVAKLEN